jgi:hypothetical protein
MRFRTQTSLKMDSNLFETIKNDFFLIFTQNYVSLMMMLFSYLIEIFYVSSLFFSLFNNFSVFFFSFFS